MTDIPHLKVRQAMSDEVHQIDAMATVREAMTMMHEHDVGFLVIPRRHETDELGLVGVINIADEVIAKNRSLDRTDVYEVMLKPVLTVDGDMDIRYAVRLLTRFRLDRAVVVDKNRDLLGIVTMRDLVLAYVYLEEEGIGA
ncbi:MAG: CBS domain-containing protein [Alphaproteobacteria bacterium]|jgi:CBS domain-containing protein|nr:CBS domain-containing protein [Alphaproteobacteria bacterium]